MKNSIQILQETFYCNGFLEGDLANYFLKSDTDMNVSFEYYEAQIKLLTKIYKGL